MFIGRPMMRRGRPGLLGTMARTAVVAGTATAVVGGMQRHQAANANEAAQAEAYQEQQQQAQVQAAAQQAAAQQAAYEPPPPPAPVADAGSNTIAELEKLGQLKQQGILSDAEFAAAKAKVLGLG